MEWIQDPLYHIPLDRRFVNSILEKVYGKTVYKEGGLKNAEEE